jgi:hypothetical protein
MTNSTETLVPRITGLPTRMPGSITIRSRQSIVRAPFIAPSVVCAPYPSHNSIGAAFSGGRKGSSTRFPVPALS